MMKTIITVLLMAVIVPAVAQEEAPKRSKQWREAAGRTGEEWIPVAWGSDDQKPYVMWSVHKTRYSRTGSIFSGWIRMDYVPHETTSNGRKITYSLMKVECDCQRTATRVISWVGYATDGTVNDQWEDKHAEFKEAGPGTFAEGLIDYVCDPVVIKELFP